MTLLPDFESLIEVSVLEVFALGSCHEGDFLNGVGVVVTVSTVSGVVVGSVSVALLVVGGGKMSRSSQMVIPVDCFHVRGGDILENVTAGNLLSKVVDFLDDMDSLVVLNV